MPKFFSDQFSGDTVIITGEDAAHIVRVLRMKQGELLTVCDRKGSDYSCEIEQAGPDEVVLHILSQMPSKSEPGVFVTLFQGLPKSDKMDWIVQKSVELGVGQIVPVFTHRCVSRPDHASMEKKTARWDKIAAEAAKQSGRGRLPHVLPAVTFDEAVKTLSKKQNPILFYEKGGMPMAEAVRCEEGEVGIMIGPEGGFEQQEAETAASMGVRVCSLGPRILRTETAPLCALSVIMFATGNL